MAADWAAPLTPRQDNHTRVAVMPTDRPDGAEARIMVERPVRAQGSSPSEPGRDKLERLGRVFDVLPDALMVFDPARNLVGLNAAARHILGIAEAGAGLTETLARASRLDPSVRVAFAEALDRILSGEGGRTRLAGGLGRSYALGARTSDAGWVVSLTAEAGDAEGQPGLLDNAAFRECLSDAWIEVQGGKPGAALLYLDLDRFRQVNDTLGHAVAEALVARVAERMRKALRNDDVLARRGGNEFAILSHTTSVEAVEALGVRLIDLVSRPYLIDGHLVSISVSIGAAFMPTDAAGPDELVRCADLALDNAVKNGRGVLRCFRPEMSERASARRLLELDLRKAVLLGEFELFYQPQFAIDGRRLTGFEALLRWNHPTRGIVSPLEFVPVAEETGQIVEIGDWVLHTAAAEASSWPEHISVAVNVSPVQFRTRQLAASVEAALARSGLAPGRLEIEITEGVLLTDEEANLGILDTIQKLGVGIALDDFGTGYASLAYLKRFPFDKIKIDKSFVREMMSSTDSDAIVASIVSLGQMLGMMTIAEGVETNEEMTRIRAHGCKAVQGYLTGRPMTSRDARRFLAPADHATPGEPV